MVFCSSQIFQKSAHIEISHFRFLAEIWLKLLIHDLKLPYYDRDLNYLSIDMQHDDVLSVFRILKVEPEPEVD